MRVRILRTTAADGRLVRAGAIEDLSERDARALIVGRKAEVCPIEDIAVEQEPDQPRRRGRPRKEQP